MTADLDRSVSVRLAVPADARELARMRWEYRVADQPKQSCDAFVEECGAWLLRAIQSGTWAIAVASPSQGTLCGCMYLEIVSKVPVPGVIYRTWGYITNSYVESGHRGAGIGTRLLDLLIGEARDRDLEFLILWPAEEALGLYARAGFRPASTLHDGPGDHEALELALR